MIKTFDKDTSKQNLLDALEADGACIIADAIDAELLARLDAEIAAGLSHVTVGQDSFTGHATKRMGALAARFPACRELILNPLTLGAAEDFLKPYCDRIQLHVSQVINIMPGQGAQQLHRDRHAFGNFLPATIEPQFNTMWALTDFTAKNGATHVIPGSHKWLMDKAVERRDSVQAEMRRGSVLLFTGSVVHSGGANRSSGPRTGINIDYTLGWLRQEENQFLSCPPEVAKDLPPELCDLLGYTMGNYALGYFSPPNFIEGTPDTLPPEVALGHEPGEMPLNDLALETREVSAG